MVCLGWARDGCLAGCASGIPPSLPPHPTSLTSPLPSPTPPPFRLVLHKIDSPTKMRFVGSRVANCSLTPPEPWVVPESIEEYVAPEVRQQWAERNAAYWEERGGRPPMDDRSKVKKGKEGEEGAEASSSDGGSSDGAAAGTAAGGAAADRAAAVDAMAAAAAGAAGSGAATLQQQ